MLRAVSQTVRSFFLPIQCGTNESRIEDSKQVIHTLESDGLAK